MPTIITHPAILLILRPFQTFRLPALVYLVGAFCSVLPDIDVVGFQYGIRYGDLLGHRGLTHSFTFAIFVSGIITFILARFIERCKDRSLTIFIFLFLCTASHGILDAFTNGGLGVAFFSPFANLRYFFPWRPLRVSPIGIADFFSGPAFEVLLSELIFVWMPCMVLFFVAVMLKRKRAGEREEV